MGTCFSLFDHHQAILQKLKVNAVQLVNKYMKVWTGFIRIRIRNCSGKLWTGWWHSGCHEMQRAPLRDLM